MRKLLKGFTLVEILIVIVIIGILIGALVPRMQSAQGRARDVARKNDLSQLQSAIVTSYSDRGQRPDMTTCSVKNSGTGCAITAESEVGKRLIAAGLNGIPTDPISTNTVSIISGTNLSGGYGYAVATKYGVEDAGFILMAHTEVEGGSNWLDCGGAGTSSSLSGGHITGGTDLQYVLPCTRLNKVDTTTGCNVVPGGECSYTNTTQLRYILVY